VVIGPLSTNKLLVPAKNRPRLKDAHDRSQLFCGSIGDILQSDSENAQDHLFSAIRFDEFIAFALQDSQLFAQNEDLKVFFIIGQNSDTKKRDQG
jgi:hypothetical protein